MSGITLVIKNQRNRKLKKKKILLVWYTLEDNFGDTMIYLTEKKKLEEKNYIVEFMDVGETCHDIIRKANSCNFLLFAGGGIIERYVPNVIRHWEEDYSELQIPYGVIGLSIGDFDYSIYQSTFAAFLRYAQFFLTRDVDTANYFNSCINEKKAVYTADIVFYNDRIKYNPSSKEQIIGINLRDVPYPDVTGDLDWKAWSALMHNKNMLLIPDFPDAMQHLVNSKEEQGVVDFFFGLDKYKKTDYIIGRIIQCNIVISMRYHISLTAAVNGVIPISIMYTPKVRRLVEQLGMESYSIELHEVAKVPQIIDYIKMNEANIRKELLIKVEGMQNKIKKSLHSVIEQIDQITNRKEE